jgi:hypothetical protein
MQTKSQYTLTCFFKAPSYQNNIHARMFFLQLIISIRILKLLMKHAVCIFLSCDKKYLLCETSLHPKYT